MVNALLVRGAIWSSLEATPSVIDNGLSGIVDPTDPILHPCDPDAGIVFQTGVAAVGKAVSGLYFLAGALADHAGCGAEFGIGLTKPKVADDTTLGL